MISRGGGGGDTLKNSGGYDVVATAGKNDASLTARYTRLGTILTVGKH